MKSYKLKEGSKVIEKGKVLIINAIRISLLIAILLAIIEFKWIVLFVSLTTLILTFIPYFIERKYKILFPLEFHLLAVVFIYASIFLGDLHGYYIRFWWWDIVLHFTSAIVFAITGFLILYHMDKMTEIKAKPIIISLFSFTFALAIGAIWEIIEFSLDIIFGLNMQKSGLFDTMGDLIVDSIAALIISIFGYLYLKNQKGIMTRIVGKFEECNPGL